MKPTLERSHAVDLLKGVAIILVVFTHYALEPAEREMLLLPWWVDMVVPLFMFLSGYVYALRSDAKRMISFSQTYDAKEITGRLLRLTIPFAVVFAATVRHDQNKGMSYQLLNAFLQGGKGQGSYYYPLMVQLVFVMPVIYFLVKRLRTKGLVIVLAANAAYEVLRIAYGIPNASYRLLLFRYLFVIACGCALGCGVKLDTKYLVGMFCVGVLFLGAHLYGGYNPKYIASWIGTSYLAVMYFVPLIWCALPRMKFGFAPLELVGRASYHILMAQMFYYYAMAPSVYASLESRWMQLIVSMALSICGGILFYFVETPIGKWIAKMAFRCIDRCAVEKNKA